MAQKTINIGTGELTGDGESIRSAFSKANDNFTELYSNTTNVETSVDLHLNTAGATNNQILSWDGSDYVWRADNSGIALTDLSVTTGSASGAGTLSYNNGSGVFTFQPADLSSYLTSTGVLSSHTDVNNASPTDGQVLTWITQTVIRKPADCGP